MDPEKETRKCGVSRRQAWSNVSSDVGSSRKRGLNLSIECWQHEGHRYFDENFFFLNWVGKRALKISHEEIWLCILVLHKFRVWIILSAGGFAKRIILQNVNVTI